MSFLDGKITLVLGGAGEVGEGVVRQFLLHGATVVVPSRSAYRLDDLKKRLGDLANERLITHQGGCSSEEGGLAMRDFIMRDVGQLDTVVAAIGGWWQGEALTELPLRIWKELLDNSLTAHFIAAKTFLPQLVDCPGSCYIMLNGGAALDVIPYAGPISVSAAAQLALMKVLAAETEDTEVRLNTLLIKNKVATRSQPERKSHWLTPDEVGLYAVYLTSGACDKHGETIIFEEHSQIPAVFQ